MNVYIYQSALVCEDCARAIRADLAQQGRAPANPDDLGSYDWDRYPAGPFADGGGEADTPQHCDCCNVFLENPLTSDGAEYVRDALASHMATGRGNRDVLRQWAEFYDYLGLAV